MNKRVVLFIKWRSCDGHFTISKYYIPEDIRDLLFRFDFSYVARVLRCFALNPYFFKECIHIQRFIIRLRSTFKLGWYIDAFSVRKKSLL